MPQPLSRVKPNAKAVKLSEGVEQRPEQAQAAMQAVAQCAAMETALTSVFVRMLGAQKAAPAARMFDALAGSNAKKDVLVAAAEHALTPEQYAVFDVLMSQYSAVLKLRYPLAHWVWGHTPDLPDSVLLCDPSHVLQLHVELAGFEENPDEEFLQKVVDGNVPTVPFDNIMVFTTSDFEHVANEAKKVIHWLRQFRYALGFPVYVHTSPHLTPALVLEWLSNVPEIRAVLDRRSQREKRS